MKLKKLTIFAFALTAAVALSISGCKDDKEGEPPKADGPKITLKEGLPGDLYWVWQNRAWEIGTKIRFGVEVQHPKEVVKIEVIRKAIAGPNNGNGVVWDTTFAPGEIFVQKTMIKELLTDGVVATQTVLFTLKATDKDGNVGEASIEIRASQAIGERVDETLWDRTENGAYDLVQAISLSTVNAPGTHDIKLSKSGSSFKLVSGNGSKFKAYNGSAIGLNKYEQYAQIESDWNSASGGAELTESPVLSEAPTTYKFIFVKSAQNGKIYVLNIWGIESDHIIFDYRGEGI